MSLLAQIKQLSKDIQSDVISWRRHIHQNPELAYQEQETAAFICKILDEHQIEYSSGIAKTGVVALIKGNNSDSRCIALRGDMDALPILESNTHNFTSKNKCAMHACGHDFHSANLLGVAVVLNRLKKDFDGTFKLIFQPSEEKIPSGAMTMIKEGVLENPKVDFMLGNHVSPELPTGTIGMRPGKFMASADEIYLTVKGKGGHAAFPNKLVDPVVIAAQIIINMQQIISRKKSPFEEAVLSFGKVIAQGATNVIPNEVKIDGTLRAMNEEFRSEAQAWIKKIAEETASSMGGTCDVNLVVGYPCLFNDEAFTEQSFEHAKEYSDNVQIIPARMGAEDFSYYSQKIPVCFYRIGTGGSPETKNGLHTSNFDVDEKAFETSVGMMAWLGVNALIG